MKYYRILLVDDEPHIINMIMRLLDSIENMELDIYYAYSAVDALDIIKKGRIDLLITDIQMPGMNGLELLQQINLFWSGTKSIVLTAYPEFHYAYEVFQQNASGYLLKTEEKEVILKTILHTLEIIDQERQMSFSISPQQDSGGIPVLLCRLHKSPGKYAFAGGRFTEFFRFSCQWKSDADSLRKCTGCIRKFLYCG